jgi:hypothetical protein
VSRSEEGLEKTFQGSTLLAHWKMTLPPGAEKNFLIHLSMDELPKKADDTVYQPSAACGQLKSKKSDS